MAKGKIAESLSEEQKVALNKIANENPEKSADGADVKTFNRSVDDAGTKTPGRRYTPRYKTPDNVESALEHYPVHIVKLVNLVKSNSDIRRYTALGILNYLFQKGIIEQAKGYVTFNWTKFRVVNKGLSTEYRYSEPFFLNCLVASFTSFANAAQKIIKTFCSKEYEEVFVQDDAIISDAVAAAEQADAESGDEE